MRSRFSVLTVSSATCVSVIMWKSFISMLASQTRPSHSVSPFFIICSHNPTPSDIVNTNSLNWISWQELFIVRIKKSCMKRLAWARLLVKFISSLSGLTLLARHFSYCEDESWCWGWEVLCCVSFIWMVRCLWLGCGGSHTKDQIYCHNHIIFPQEKSKNSQEKKFQQFRLVFIYSTNFELCIFNIYLSHLLLGRREETHTVQCENCMHWELNIWCDAAGGKQFHTVGELCVSSRDIIFHLLSAAFITEK